MTGAELKTMTESILSDTVDDTLFYNLLNVAKNRVEDLRAWQMLKALDSSQVAPTGNNATTPIALPTAWRRTYKLLVGADQEFLQVPFDEQHRWRYASNLFCVDVANSVYYLLGTIGSAATIYHYYIKSTSDIASGSSPVWPARFHPILAFDVAGFIMMGTDADEIYARMSPENKNAAVSLYQSMVLWDTQLQIDAQGGQLKFIGDQPPEVHIGKW